MSKFTVGQKVKIRDDADLEYTFDYGEECIGKELEVKAIFMDHGVEISVVHLTGVNYCFVSDALELIKTEAEKRRDDEIEFINSFIRCWQTSSNPIESLGNLLYHANIRRTHELTDDAIAERAYFEGMRGKAELWVNGYEAGMHEARKLIIGELEL